MIYFEYQPCSIEVVSPKIIALEEMEENPLVVQKREANIFL
jgi:hypothetical protein